MRAGTLELVTPPVDEPITLAEAKEHVKEDSSEFDTYIEGLITVARMFIEENTGRALMTQTWVLRLDHWPEDKDDWWDGVREGAIANLHVSNEVEIRKAPFQSVSEVRTLDEEDSPTVWAASNYYTATRSGFGRLVAKQGSVFPVIPVRRAGAIEIEFTAGYGDNGTDVPYPIRQAMKMLIFHWFQHRLAVDQCVTGSTQGAPQVPLGFNSLISHYRVLAK